MRAHRIALGLVLSCSLLFASAPTVSGAGQLPSPTQGTQSNSAYAASYAAKHVTNVVATTQRVSCYRPEAPYFTNNGPSNAYSGMRACQGGATTGEDTGLNPYATQLGSNPGFPASEPMLVTDHSESDLQIDPTNPQHLIGSSKWFVSAEGYNHQLGFYESFDGGQTWPVQGHIPGYEGWTDVTDPVGAFDSYGNYYSLLLPYQFFYNRDGSKNYTVGTSREPNPALPAEAIAVALRPHGAATATDWRTTTAGQPDYVATYDSVGREPDKQWLTIDTHATLPDGSPNPHFNTIYAMWVVFTGGSSKPYVATATALADGTHTAWSTPRRLPTSHGSARDTYLLPHVAPDGVVYTPVTNFAPAHGYCCASLALDYSTDGGQTWQGPLPIVDHIQLPPLLFANTTFRDGIEDSFGVGIQRSTQGHYPLYLTWEDYSAGVTNILLAVSNDGGQSWSAPIRVNDNVAPVDAFQPNLAVAPNGTVSVAFYDRRLACPVAGGEATAAGLPLDTTNPNYAGPLPPYGVTNYCVNASVQFYGPQLAPRGKNIRLTAHSWDPQLSAPHPGCATCTETFIGDYFGHVSSGMTSYSTFVSTYDDGTNPGHHQQQVVATVALP